MKKKLLILVGLAVLLLLSGCKSDKDTATELADQNLKNYLGKDYSSLVVDEFNFEKEIGVGKLYEMYGHVYYKGKYLPIHMHIQHNDIDGDHRWVFAGCNCDVVMEQAGQ